MKELKPCPFCGSYSCTKKVYSSSTNDDTILYRIECKECHSKGPETTSEITAEILWNIAKL